MRVVKARLGADVRTRQCLAQSTPSRPRQHGVPPTLFRWADGKMPGLGSAECALDARGPGLCDDGFQDRGREVDLLSYGCTRVRTCPPIFYHLLSIVTSGHEDGPYVTISLHMPEGLFLVYCKEQRRDSRAS